MNQDVEQALAELALKYPHGADKWDAMREAMRFAYSDAAKVCREKFAYHYNHSQRKVGAEECAEAIEARAK